MSLPGDIQALARAAAAEPALPEELEAFARIEGLMGQEHALLLVPAAKRTDRERRLLDAVTAELDRIVEKLKERPVRPAV
ncbi:MAG: hypothetical protein ACXVR9_16860 [Gaiellaceae bacterium]